MAGSRIIAHFAHESELGAARSICGSPETVTDSYAIFPAPDGAVLDKLRDAGLIVETLAEPPMVFRRVEGVGMPMGTTPGGAPEVGFEVGGIVEPELEPDRAGYHLITLSVPLTDGLHRRIQNIKVDLLAFVPPSSYTAYLTVEQNDDLRKIAEVAAVRPYGDRDTGSPFGALSTIVRAATPKATTSWEIRPQDREDFAAVLELLNSRGADMQLRGRVIQMTVPAGSTIPDEVRKLPGEPLVNPIEPLFDLRLHRESDLTPTLDWLRGEGIQVVGSSRRKIRINLEGDDGTRYERIRAFDAVADIDPFLPPHVDNDQARRILGVDSPAGNPLLPAVFPFDGSGETVGVADTGVDDQHPDLVTRLKRTIARGRPGVWNDPHGHGTHVCGSIAGDGSQSVGGIRGIAPAADLVVQSLLDSTGRLGGLPIDLNDLFDEAYQLGVRIHNNSWGSATESEYVVNSEEVDEFVWDHQDMLIVISAGNEGTASTSNNSNTGFVDLFSIGSPATAKNALTVGASRSARTNGGYSQLTYGQAWLAHFPRPPIAGETISGNDKCIAGFSSRGPCTDHRMKPDVVAPGTDILSTRSSLAPGKRFWGLDATHPNHYAYMGGTSMAAPLVAGCAALVRQYYRNRGHDPSAALLKATLINSTVWLTGWDAVANHPNAPNYHQGFGMVSMPRAIPATPGSFQLDFIDGWKMPGEVFRASGERRRYAITAAADGELRVCLTWTDPPARSLQNILHLTVQNLQTGKKVVGNEGRPMSLMTLDRDNNVQIVRIPVKAGEQFMIMVSNTSLLRTPQPFALVVASTANTPMTTYHG